MRPRIVGIDAGEEVAEQPLHPLVVGRLLGGRVREPVLGAIDAVDEVVRRRPFDRRVGRSEREAELVDEPEVGSVRVADELAPELHRAATVHRDLLDPAAHTVSGLEHGHIRAAGDEIPRRGQPGEAGSEDEDVDQRPGSSSSASTRSASGGR